MSNEIMAYGQPETRMSETASVTAAMSTSREAQEVQAAVFMAKNFPRDENRAIARIQQCCKRPGLAEKAIYTYPRGGQNVSGPSIRLAEALAQSWGNLQSGVVELEQRDGESTCMAYCWDIETNFREIKVFAVPHVRTTKKGTQVLTDPRDIYELVANQGARRKRACILAVIPKDVVDVAVDACMATLANNTKGPLIDRLRTMVAVFQNELSVPLESLERYMGYKLDAFTEMDMVTLRGIYNNITQNGAKREDYFTLPKAPELAPTAVEEAPVSEGKPSTKRKLKPGQVTLDDV